MNLLLIFISATCGFILGMLYMHYREYTRIEKMLDEMGRDFYKDFFKTKKRNR